ncbi:SgcJ/EcaC family oxidoreductase [Streptomyces sp. RB6PN25]|uniref:SgcJ/EcaC family oxidoreductase n=1 Tax=Streptomyces humicola TaxID=2953240 RepID=A0ABT1PVJ5_9ACTN|nr:SgcJ/EcaC family oxidoreductase [Streptomyces humicola]MCQ4081693.1 SgcJ/EcaC family oxidoreductase [Streptomyces humicola]
MRRTYSAGVAVAATAALLAGTASTSSTYAAGPRPRTTAGHTATARAVTSAVLPALPTRMQIAGLFDRWNAALATGDADRVADLYAPDAVLLPTLSARMRTTRAGIVDYFAHFLESRPVARIQQRVIDVLDATSAVDTGLYRFTLTGKDGTTSTVDARYTFVYELRGGRWLIVSHHSSALPTGG